MDKGRRQAVIECGQAAWAHEFRYSSDGALLSSDNEKSQLLEINDAAIGVYHCITRGIRAFVVIVIDPIAV